LTVRLGQIGGAGNELGGAEAPVLGVSCASSALCVAVDAGGNVLTSVDPGSSESTWTRTAVATVPLLSVSCPSVTFCVAVGRGGAVLTSTNPTGARSAWTTAYVDGSKSLTSVSCVSDSLCIATGSVGELLTSGDPAGGAAAWSADDVDTGHELTDVSCTPGGLCVAVDDAGDAVVGTLLPPAADDGGEPGVDEAAGSSTAAGLPTRTPAAVSDKIGLRVKAQDGRIVLTLTAPVAGSFSARATAMVGEAVGAARKKRSGVRGSRELSYGTATAIVPAAGAVTVAVEPTRNALSALRGSHALQVAITAYFLPREGSPESVRGAVMVHYQASRNSRRSRR
jgi:hypothetical protein